MTTKEKLLEMLVSKGLSQKDAEQVFDKAKPMLEESGRVSWNQPANGYPDFLYVTMFITMRPIALQWINDNCPQAWFRPMFAEPPDASLLD